MDKLKELKKVAGEISRCRECKKNKSGLPVPGEGNPDAKVMFVGEAPGIEESKTGRPFVGRAGKFLTKMLDSIGINRKEVYITSPVKYFPGRRAPTDEEIAHGRIHLIKQIKIIRPKMIVPLGNVALKALIPNEKIFVSKVHGKIIERDGATYFPTFHPSAAMRFTKMRNAMIGDMKELNKIIRGISR
ncbi:MAG TPA: uracil-DNA glycosylase [archaeon]|nr:uracil-DNA glycosylase [archaeon]